MLSESKKLPSNVFIFKYYNLKINKYSIFLKNVLQFKLLWVLQYFVGFYYSSQTKPKKVFVLNTKYIIFLEKI